jgi:hypothetical protein
MRSLRHRSTQISGPLKTYADILIELRLRTRQLHLQSPCKSQIYRPRAKSDFAILYADSFAQDLYNDLVRRYTRASYPNTDPDSDPDSVCEASEIVGWSKTYAYSLTEQPLRMRRPHLQSPCKYQVQRPCIRPGFSILHADPFAQDCHNDLVRCHTGASDSNADPDPDPDADPDPNSNPDSNPNSNPDSNPSNV